MPIISPEAYERLGQHLKEIDPIFRAFLLETGYSDNTGTLGRYPHRSAVLLTDVSRKIDLQMELDETGELYSVFEPSIPYSLWAGAWVDVEGRRYCPDRGIMIFQRMPFHEMVPKLGDLLKKAAAALEPYTRTKIISQSTPFRIG